MAKNSKPEPHTHYEFKSGPETAVHRLDVAVYHLCRPLCDIVCISHRFYSLVVSLLNRKKKNMADFE